MSAADAGTVGEPHPLHLPPGQVDPAYASMVARIRDLTAQHVPPGVIGLVFSRGDSSLIDAPGRTMWHFPRLPEGQYTSFYPRDDIDAIFHLHQAMLAGAAAIVVPGTSFWWADSYPGLFEEIGRRFVRVHDDPASCWIYRLQPAPDPPTPSIGPTARLADAIDVLLGGLHGPDHRAHIRRLIVYLLSFEALSEPGEESVILWERLGLHIVPADFSSPIPAVGEADRGRAWAAQYSLDGVDLQDERQLATLSRLGALTRVPKDGAYFEAVRLIADDPQNLMFMTIDAFVYAAMLLDARPRTIVEVGSGYSTLIALAYKQHVQDVSIVCIEPSPPRIIEALSSDHRDLRRQPVQAADPELFRALVPGDILFFDGSHIARMGSDVHHLFFNVLPHLAAGVLVQIHDIFLPGEYPRHLIVPRGQFWNEQYLLYAFLQYNSAFEVVLATSYLRHVHPGALTSAFGGIPEGAGGSFWLRRRPDLSG